MCFFLLCVYVCFCVFIGVRSVFVLVCCDGELILKGKYLIVV